MYVPKSERGQPEELVRRGSGERENTRQRRGAEKIMKDLRLGDREVKG